MEVARAGDIVLIAGKGHEQGQEFAGGRKVPFDDREVARDALRALGAPSGGVIELLPTEIAAVPRRRGSSRATREPPRDDARRAVVDSRVVAAG